MFDDKTCNGAGRFYFCLRNGFENVPKKVGPNAPLDEYGLSMIAVSITMEGEPNSITCRWNHDNGGSDSVMDDEQLSELLGVNFYRVFKPYTREELHAKGVILFDEVQPMLDNGVSPTDIFEFFGYFYDDYARVSLNNKWNFINKTNKLLSDTWYDTVYDFSNGYANVNLNGKWNLIDTNGKLISDMWFDAVYDFRNGYANVRLDDKYNFINQNGKLLSDTWFDSVDNFYDGYAKVQLDNKWNLIDTNGKLISDRWFDEVGGFHDGYALVKLGDKYNFINQNGKYINNILYDYAGDFYHGYALVEIDDEWFKIYTNGKLYAERPE